MVFTEVQLIYGKKFDSFKDVKTFLGKKYSKYTTEDVDENLSTQYSLNLFTPHCCAEMCEKSFIIGKKVRSINRLDVYCPECPDFSRFKENDDGCFKVCCSR